MGIDSVHFHHVATRSHGPSASSVLASELLSFAPDFVLTEIGDTPSAAETAIGVLNPSGPGGRDRCGSGARPRRMADSLPTADHRASDRW